MCVVEDARLFGGERSQTVIRFFNTSFEFSSMSTQWKCVRNKNVLYCCYLGSSLSPEDYEEKSFTRKILNLNEKLSPAHDIRLRHPINNLRIHGNVNARLEVHAYNDVQRCFYLDNNASASVFGHNIRVKLSQKHNSALNIYGSVLEVVVEDLEKTCVLDMSKSSVSSETKMRFLIPKEETGIALINTDMISGPSSRSSCKRIREPVTTIRQMVVKHAISVPSHAAQSREGADTCPTCFSSSVNAVYVPCSHSYTCLNCTERLRTVARTNFVCPLCRTEIDAVLAQ